MGQEFRRLTCERRPKSTWLDLFAILHLFYATLFLIGPATDLGGLIWFPFFLLGASCLVLAWGIWLRRSWGKAAGIAMSVLFPVVFAISFEREWHAGSWAVLGYLPSACIVAPVYVVELVGIWLLIPTRGRAISAKSSLRPGQSALFERVILAGTLTLAVLAECVLPREPNLRPVFMIAIGLLPAAAGLYLLTKVGK